MFEPSPYLENVDDNILEIIWDILSSVPSQTNTFVALLN